MIDLALVKSLIDVPVRDIRLIAETEPVFCVNVHLFDRIASLRVARPGDAADILAALRSADVPALPPSLARVRATVERMQHPDLTRIPRNPLISMMPENDAVIVISAPATVRYYSTPGMANTIIDRMTAAILRADERALTVDDTHALLAGLDCVEMPLSPAEQSVVAIDVLNRVAALRLVSAH